MIRIRRLRFPEELLQAEKIQKAVWQFADRELVPLTELAVAQKIGGVVLGAFAKKEMIGFCFGVPAYDGKNIYHHSRMLGVLPKYQDLGIGYKLKIAQREFVKEQGLDLVRWTFDPLQSRNALFNIEKLGVVVRTYLINVYGDMSSSVFNVGLETDRFYPEWWINSKRVSEKLKGGRTDPKIVTMCAPATEVALTGDGLPYVKKIRLKLRQENIRVHVPLDIDGLKAKNMSLAKSWRHNLRQVFISYFNRGYLITGFVYLKDSPICCGQYILIKGLQKLL
jgi:predicted GNAT superfamily acetyltransferase